ncbi:uncharacterized protein SPSK_07288 [Sporothrix schenckii 1099-18]|uniref:BZIP transcription factor n=1 Tax=Sporothrix schenckii 1099-18 TaxID=1397361 RepID=A0A0F2MHG4_SPOSC|nr:uncharacterized protein SPSK_07288 [Sporothrix schenckii 1099-18]KJR88489.1 hypothetical protein SPSK_07288 [Sporothrix schenckii 1099-18]
MTTRVHRGRVTRVGTIATAPTAASSAIRRSDTDAAERKRLRDRVAQQNLRNKRNRHIEALEKQVKLCQELHGPRSEADGLNSGSNHHNEQDLRTIRHLQAENAALRERHNHLQALFQSFKNVFEPAVAASTPTMIPAAVDGLPSATAPNAPVIPTPIPVVPTVSTIPDAITVETITNSTGIDSNQTPKPHQPLDVLPDEPDTPPTPPLQPQLQATSSPVSSASTTEIAMYEPVHPYYNYDKSGPVLDTLPDYSLWLAGISAISSSTDGESESEVVFQHEHNHNGSNKNGHDYIADGADSVINNIAQSFPMESSSVPLPAAAVPSLVGSQHVSFRANVNDLWGSRTAVPLSAAMQATDADLAANCDSTAAMYDPFEYSGRLPSTGLSLWSPFCAGTVPDMENVPVWARTPVRYSGPNDVRRPDWDANTRIVFDSPEVPAPLDILYGSHHNSLASCLQRSGKTYYQRDPERLAIGWLVYHYVKWRMQPSAARYAMLPTFLQPLHEQVWVPHPGSLDFVIWEGPRRKLLKTYDRYDVVKFIRRYCRCLRLRWRREEDVLVTNVEGKHVLRPDFVERFMSTAGWGLDPEFVKYYPELFDGDEWDQIVYNPSGRQGL